MRIIIIPDTNILIHRLDIISSFLKGNHPFHVELLILKIVLEELDHNKKINHKAQKANTFLLENMTNKKLNFEGEISENGMEIILEYPNLLGCNTNDDKIINIVSFIRNSIIITSDKNMYLKCKSKNVKCVYVQDSAEYSEVNLDVMMSQTGAELMEISEDLPESSTMRICCDLLKPKIEQILKYNFGPGFDIRYKKIVKEADLIELIDLCINEFSIFNGYLHSSSKNLLIKINKTLREEIDDLTKKKAIKNLLTIFKINNEI